MPLMDWTDDLVIGFTIIDTHHRRLVEMINELYDAMIEIKGQEALRVIVNGMVEYATIHFMTEEKYMLDFSYEGYPEHKKIHEDFKLKALDLQEKLSNEDFVLSLDVLNFLRDWLKGHIQGTDRSYIECFRDNGVE